MKLILFRHTEAENNVMKGRIFGHSQHELTPDGIISVKDLSKHYKSMQVDAVYSSDAPRCMSTACYIFGESEITATSLLRERDVGLLSSSPKNKAVGTGMFELLHQAIDKIMQESDLCAPGGESWNLVQLRADLFLQSVIESSDQCIAVVTHKGMIRSLLRRASADFSTDNISLGSVRTMEVSPTFILRCQIKKELKMIIKTNKNLSNKIRSVYAIGSLAKNESNVGDIDLNIIAKDVTYITISAIEILQNELGKIVGRTIDLNIIDEAHIANNFINSELFPHKNRHSLLLYELVIVPCLLYGSELLSSYQIHYSDLLFEAYKLSITQVHRMNKEYLAKDKQKAIRGAHKYARYACEFALIFKGYLNPYVDMSSEIFLSNYPELVKYKKTVRAIFSHTQAIDDISFANYYDFTVMLVKVMRIRLMKMLHDTQNCKIVISESYADHPDALFVFPNYEELDLYKKNHERLPDYKKIF